MGTSLVAAGLVIFRRLHNDLQYLMLQTSYGEHHWTPPKGHVDPGEEEFETALRETKEEAGLSREQLYIFDSFKEVLTYDVKGRQKNVIYWLAELKDPHTQITLSDEHQTYEWLNLESAQRYAKYPDLQKLLHKADSFINTLSSSS